MSNSSTPATSVPPPAGVVVSTWYLSVFGSSLSTTVALLSNAALRAFRSSPTSWSAPREGCSAPNRANAGAASVAASARTMRTIDSSQSVKPGRFRATARISLERVGVDAVDRLEQRQRHEGDDHSKHDDHRRFRKRGQTLRGALGAFLENVGGLHEEDAKLARVFTDTDQLREHRRKQRALRCCGSQRAAFAHTCANPHGVIARNGIADRFDRVVECRKQWCAAAEQNADEACESSGECVAAQRPHTRQRQQDSRPRTSSFFAVRYPRRKRCTDEWNEQQHRPCAVQHR